MYIGKDTETEQTKLITNGVFLVQFFNTGFLLLLVNANLSEQSTVLGFIFSGGMPDFNSDWFSQIGNTLISAMMFNIYWPIIEFFCFFGMRLGFRLLDRKFTCNVKSTKKTTIQQYVEIYSGPVYFIHYKYSSILNITFVTLMYGIGLPVLFPVAAIAILVLFIVERCMIYYSYRQPPLYDEKLSNSTLNILCYAPLLMLAFGFWMISNHQLMDNDLSPISFSSDNMNTGHRWTSAFLGEGYKGPHMPLLIMFWALLLVVIFRGTIYNCLYYITPKFLRLRELELDEDIENYYRCLDDHDRNWSVKEEEYARNNLGLKILLIETLDKMKNTGKSRKTI